MDDHTVALIYDKQIKPLLLFLYGEALLNIPETFSFDIEGPRLVATLRAQGFAARFSTAKKSGGGG